MNYLLDTNAVSEWVRPRPDPGVIAWLDEVDEDATFLSVVTLAELRYGVMRLAPGARRRRIERWLREELPVRFAGRLLPIDQEIATAWGDVVAERAAEGRPIGPIDAFIAATTRVRQLALVTRNTADFSGSVETLLNPWATR